MKRILLSALTAALLLACTQPDAAGETWPILESFAQPQCVWQSPVQAARVFSDESQWQAAFPIPQNYGFKQTIDWTKHAVIALTIGERASTGYSVELDDKAFKIERGVLQLGFHERTPAADAMQQQVLIQPCVFILTRRGAWQKVSLRNTETGARLEATTPAANVKTNSGNLR